VGAPAVALLHDAVPVLLLLIPAGVAWVVVLSTLNASLQLFLPAWVRLYAVLAADDRQGRARLRRSVERVTEQRDERAVVSSSGRPRLWVRPG
jgi:hypothetical protein